MACGSRTSASRSSSFEHLVDGVPDDKPVTLKADELAGRRFWLRILLRPQLRGRQRADRAERDGVPKNSSPRPKKLCQAQQKELAAAIKRQEQRRGEKPGKISCVTDRSQQPPEVFLLVRGNHADPWRGRAPAPLAALAEPAGRDLQSPRRKAAEVDRTPSGLGPLADPPRFAPRRSWPACRPTASGQHHFGTGIVADDRKPRHQRRASLASGVARLSGERVDPHPAGASRPCIGCCSPRPLSQTCSARRR